MSGYHIAFPTVERSQIVSRASLAHVRMEAWSLTTLILACTGALWTNSAWMIGLWQLAVFGFALCAALAVPNTVKLEGRIPLYLSFGIPICGALQMMLGHAAYNYATLQASLAWSVFPSFMVLGIILLREHRIRDLFLSSLWFLAMATTAMELYQLLVLGRYTVLPSGYPLMSSNLYAELTELLLPAVLATAIRKGGHLWAGCALSALMIGTTVSAGARMGTALLLLEAVLVLWATQRMQGYRSLTLRKHGLVLAGLLALVLALEGTAELSNKARQLDAFAGRPQILHSALEMARQHPLIGFGLGTFQTVYPAFDRLNSSYTINHVHNDYLEIVAETGLLGILLWLATIAAAVPRVLKTPWAFGTVAILVHGLTDFPLYRLPVVALMALLFAAANVRGASQMQPAPTPLRLNSSSKTGK